MQCRVFVAAKLALTVMTAVPTGAAEINFATQTSALERWQRKSEQLG